MSAPPSACMGWSGWVGLGIKMTAPPVAHHSAVVPCFCGVLAFFCRLSQLLNSLLLSIQALFTATSCPLPGSMSKPHFPAPSPPPDRRHVTQAGLGKAAVQTVCTVLTLSCLSQMVHRVLWSSEGSFLSPQISPPWGDFLIARTSSRLQLPPRVAGPFFDSFFFLSFFLPHCEGIFLVLLGVQSLLLMFSRYSVWELFHLYIYSWCPGEETWIPSPSLLPSRLLFDSFWRKQKRDKGDTVFHFKVGSSSSVWILTIC